MQRSQVALGNRSRGALGDSAPMGRYAFLTFDDGYEDNYTNALPLLRQYGFTAWIFVLPPLVERQAAL